MPKARHARSRARLGPEQATEIELTLANSVQQLDAGDRHRSTVEDLEPEHRVDA